jgi:hypothetical protein
MRASFIRLWWLLLGGGPSGRAAAQDIWKPKRETPRTERPAPTPPTGRRTPRPRRERAQPAATRLTVQGQLHKFTEDGLRKLVSSSDTFGPQDKLQFSIKVNQNGFLYVIRQTTPDGNGQLLFPSKYHNGGNSYVKEDQEFLLPSNCNDFAAPCWFRLSASGQGEKLTVIFSRDRVDSLPAQVARGDGPAAIPAQTLARLVAGSAQQLRRVDGIRVPGVQDDRNTFWVTNTNEKVNEEIIYTLPLKGEGGVKGAAGAVKD